MLNKMLKIVGLSLMFATCGAMQMPEDGGRSAELLRAKLEPIKRDITVDQCKAIIAEIPALSTYSGGDSVEAQCGSRGIIWMDIRVKCGAASVKKIKKFKIYVGRSVGDVKVTKLKPKTPTHSAHSPDSVAVREDEESHISRTHKKDQAVDASLKRCPLVESPSLTPPLGDETSFNSEGSGFVVGGYVGEEGE